MKSKPVVKKSFAKQKHSVVIVWGETIDKEQALNPSEYSFETKAELDAFLMGVGEADGWLGCSVFDTKKEHKEWLKEEGYTK